MQKFVAGGGADFGTLNEMFRSGNLWTFPGLLPAGQSIAPSIESASGDARRTATTTGLAMAIVVGTVAVVINLMVAFAPNGSAFPMNAGPARKPAWTHTAGRAARRFHLDQMLRIGPSQRRRTILIVVPIDYSANKRSWSTSCARLPAA